MARLDVLDQTARQEFERPPALNPEQRQRFFALTTSLRHHLRGLDTAVNRIGFLLQWGYFDACGRFFKPNTFAPADVVHVARLLSVDPLLVKLGQYNRKTISRHRQMIRQELGFTAFAGPGKVMARSEIDQLVSRQIHPEQMFWS